MLPGSSETSIIYLLGQNLRKHKTKRKISPHLFRADRPEQRIKSMDCHDVTQKGDMNSPGLEVGVRERCEDILA